MEAPEEDGPGFSFRFPDPAPLARGDAVQLREVSFGFPAPPSSASAPGAGGGGKVHLMFHRLSLPIAPDARLCLVGPNGAGKSTLMKLLQGGAVHMLNAVDP
jgi:ATP-binding cassette subfamily F protein 2